MAIRPDAARVDFYFAFGLETALLLARDLGIRLRGSCTMAVNTDDPNQVEGLGLVSAGFFIPVALDD